MGQSRSGGRLKKMETQTFPLVFFGQGYRMRGTGENMDGVVGFLSTRRAERARDDRTLHSSTLTIGMEGPTKG